MIARYLNSTKNTIMTTKMYINKTLVLYDISKSCNLRAKMYRYLYQEILTHVAEAYNNT